jgi:hypothetical protein
MAGMAWWGTVIADERGRDYYLWMINKQDFYKRAAEYYLYVSDAVSFKFDYFNVENGNFWQMKMGIIG